MVRRKSGSMPSSNVSQGRGRHVVLGVALLVIGYALLVIAYQRQAIRARSGEPSPACGGSAEAVHGNAPPHTELSPATDDMRAATAPSMGSAISPTPSAASSSGHHEPGDASHEAGLDSEGHIFSFLPGALAMAKEEKLRLTALGQALARQPELRVTVEGYGDTPGADADTVTMAHRRAKIGQMVLAKAGVAEARVGLAVGDASSDPKLLRAIRITAAPGAKEVDP